jgi:hypothetical protein
MINLLPPESKQQIAYARKNRVLVRWITAVFFVAIGVACITLFGQYYISKNSSNLRAVAVETEQRIANQNLESTQKEIETLSNNMKTVLQILNKQLLFSKVITKIGSVLPVDSALTGVNLSATDSAIELEIVSSNRTAASQAFVNISDPKNGLFEKADLLSVECPKAPSRTDPCTTAIKVVIKTDSSFYYLNSVSGASR